jgi:hypothetical protein
MSKCRLPARRQRNDHTPLQLLERASMDKMLSLSDWRRYVLIWHHFIGNDLIESCSTSALIYVG